MKKSLYVLLFVLCIQLMCFAQRVKPNWEMVCKKGYENPQKQTVKAYWTDARKQDANEQNYWFARKENFENEIAKCDKLSAIKLQDKCYVTVVERENELNLAHEKEIMLKTQKIINNNQQVIDNTIKQNMPTYDMYLNDHNNVNRSIYWHY